MALLEHETDVIDPRYRGNTTGLVSSVSEFFISTGNNVTVTDLEHRLIGASGRTEFNFTLGRLTLGQEAVVVPTDVNLYGEEAGVLIPGTIISEQTVFSHGRRKNSVHFEPKISGLWSSLRKVITDEMLWYKEIKMFAKFDLSLFEAALIPVHTALTSESGLGDVRRKPKIVDYNVSTLFALGDYIVNK
jgi:hypothetical protein